MTQTFSSEQLVSGLSTKEFGRKLFTFEEIDSTNTCARMLAETGAVEGTVVWADHQTAGKGRLGRSWNDHPGTNLLLSVVLRSLPPEHASRASYYVSEAVARGIESEIDVRIAAKWPNDLLLNGRKICGMLLESGEESDNRFLIAGIGINVNQQDFPADISGRATSLMLETGSPVDRSSLFYAIMTTMEALISDIREQGDAGALEAWKARCQTFGKSISVRSGTEEITGTAIGLSTDGGLQLETAAGLRTVHAGDVTVIPSEGTDTQ